MRKASSGVDRCRDKSTGFTLVELLVYIGILTLALASIVVLLTNATAIVIRVKEVKEVRSSALLSLDRMSREIRGAETIIATESTLGEHPGVLTLESQDEVGNPREVVFELGADNELMLFYNSSPRGSLTAENVIVEELEFYRVDNTRSESVRIKLTLSHLDAPTKPETFYVTVVLRGSY